MNAARGRNALGVVLCLAVLASGCLKTRAQLKEEDQDEGPRPAAKGTPVQVQPVEPQGQYVIDEIKAELARLAGRMDDIERAQKQASGPSSDEFKKLETRIVELERAQAAMIEALKKAEQTAVPAQDPTEVFERGKNQLEAGNADAAAETLGQYLKFPKGKHTEEAIFLRGDAYFQLKDFKKAIVEYSKITEKYPKSKKVASALFKIAQSFEALGMREDARGFYQEIVDRHPKAPEAKKAKAKLPR